MNQSVQNASSQPIIQLNNVCKAYEDRAVLQDISFSVKPGEILAVIGPSGVGKSTILRLISELEPADKGEIITTEKKIGMAFQYSALLNSYTVAENIAFALHDSKFSEEEIAALVHETLDLVELDEFYDSMPDKLSGGQQKRVSFARAIIGNPKIILYDEPTAGLDPITSTLIENYILKLSKRLKAASIVVTHQLSTIRRTADRIICLFKGGIVWEGTVSQLDTDQNEYIRQFIDGKPDGPFTSHH